LDTKESACETNRVLLNGDLPQFRAEEAVVELVTHDNREVMVPRQVAAIPVAHFALIQHPYADVQTYVLHCPRFDTFQKDLELRQRPYDFEYFETEWRIAIDNLQVGRLME
jgi:hypothetical protein